MGFLFFNDFRLRCFFCVAAMCPKPYASIIGVTILLSFEILLFACCQQYLPVLSEKYQRVHGTLTKSENTNKQEVNIPIGLIIDMIGGIVGSASWVFLLVSKTADAFVIIAMTAVVVLILFSMFSRLKSLRVKLSPLQAIGFMSVMLFPLGIIGLLNIYFRFLSWKELPSEDLHMIIAINIAMLVAATIINTGRFFCYVMERLRIYLEITTVSNAEKHDPLRISPP